MSRDRLPNDAPAPRLCRIDKAKADEELGFNLHAEKNLFYIGEVDPDGLASLAHIRPGDRVIAVNGVFIRNLNHKKVAQLIMKNPMMVEFLVIDEAGENWFQSNGISITLNLSNIQRFSN